MGILKGKIIKKDDAKNMRKLDIQAYPWLSFQEKNIVFPDNPRRSVILQKYHDPKEMREKVKEATQFNQLLERKTSPLFPIDLTLDYEKGVQELVKRKRRHLMGEEEAMALELAEVDTSQGMQFSTTRDRSSYSKYDHPLQEKNEKSYTQQEENVVKSEKQKSTTEDVIIEKENLTSQVEDIPEPPKEVAKETAIPEPDKIILPKPENTEENERLKQEKYLEDEKNGFEQGRENGYLDGFKDGEERAIKAQESKYESVFKNVAKVIDQIEKLKDNLYSQSKEVFVEIIKLSAEKILREQVKISDSSLFALFDEVIQSISKTENIKLELNADDLVRMKVHIEKLGIQERVSLKEDKNKQAGDFTVESAKGISVVNLQKTLDNLIEKLKSELFSNEETIHEKAV